MELLPCLHSAIDVWLLLGLSPRQHYLFHRGVGFIKCLHYYWWMADWLLKASDQIRKWKVRQSLCGVCVSAGCVWEKDSGEWVSVRETEREREKEHNSMQCIGVMLLQKVKWISRHLQEITLRSVRVCAHACTRMMHHLSQCLSACPCGALNEQACSANRGQGHGCD